MKLKHFLATGLGFMALGLGAVGIVLPLLPTTPFVLLATVCFSYGSRRFYGWIRHSPVFGTYIENYRTKQSIPMSTKVKSIVLLWTSLVISMILLQTYWVFVVLSVVGVCVSIHLLLIKTERAENLIFTPESEGI